MEIMETASVKPSFNCSITCKYHQEETFLCICMEKICQKRYELCCIKCQEERHVNHSLLSLSKFFEVYNNEREKYFHGLDNQIQKLIESYENIDKDFNRAINNISQARDLLKNSIQSFKAEFRLFEDEIEAVEGVLSNIKRNNFSYDDTQQFLDQYIEKSSFYCSFKDINKSYQFQLHAKQFLAYFNEQSINTNKIFGDQLRQEGMIMNLKSLNGSAELLKNQARILLTSKQDFSFLNKQIQEGSYVDESDKIEIKELASKQWNEVQHIIDTASSEFLQAMPQIDLTIDLSVKAHQKEQVISLLKNNKKLKSFRINLKHFQPFEDGSLTEVLNEYQQKLENFEILQESGSYQEQYTRKMLETLKLTSLRKLKLDITFLKPQMHKELLKLISENHWLEDINLNLSMHDINRQKIKDYLTAISHNQILKKLKLNFSCINNPPYISQDTLEQINDFFANNKEIQMFIIGQNIECEYYKEIHNILQVHQNPNLKILDIDAKPAHKGLSFLNLNNQLQELQKCKTILENNPNLISLKLHNFDQKLINFFEVKKKALKVITYLQFRMRNYRKEIVKETFSFLEEPIFLSLREKKTPVKNRALNMF
ncbi:hypothetical protein TTHERM_00624130 (macronuclear) [Tetrahymena thermophila SB210]|uniref:Uncharacterized protein n=1 Tax=Tetrahymena thermophila (strain SB210) TaxID=312017 RepID=Q240X0_TETTS|nr:hypothetical protein TTHERM_00624130 [Tetrahymena thermophila SB210]EAS02294.2 hypothetical protein TTHERM_00624130 [Tetrahymena thermophila SB210]|eukprot:XP_001022539.2 hypothetical protein TTHERM_00624130 [Tetrahymena thermophila SB210]